jgi:hypothetical protein
VASHVAVLTELLLWELNVLGMLVRYMAGLIKCERFLLDIPTGQGLGDFFYGLL